jgi:hypothetical protein
MSLGLRDLGKIRPKRLRKNCNSLVSYTGRRHVCGHKGALHALLGVSAIAKTRLECYQTKSALKLQNLINQENPVSKLEQCCHIESVINQQNKDLALLLWGPHRLTKSQLPGAHRKHPLGETPTFFQVSHLPVAVGTKSKVSSLLP